MNKNIENIYDDYLNRKELLDIIVNYIRNNTKVNSNHISFSIDGKWGQGKSWLIEKIVAKLKLVDITKSYSKEDLNNEISEDYFIFKYNAWEMDYYDDPLVGIIVNLCNELNKDYNVRFNKVTNEALKKIMYDSLGYLSSVLSDVSKKIIGVDAIDISKKIGKKIKEVSKIKINTKNNVIGDDIICLCEVLNNLSKEKSIIFIVDEIDRCLPEYAIKTLERLHHIFSKVKNSFTILSIDEKQIEESIKKIYGNNVDIKKYLEKFTMCSFKLDKGLLSDNYDCLFKKYEIDYFLNQIDENHLFVMKLLFEPFNAREIELLLKRFSFAMSNLKVENNKIDDQDIFIGCLFVDIINYMVENKRLSLDNISPYNRNSPVSRFEEMIYNNFKDVTNGRQTKLYVIWYNLLCVFTSLYNSQNNNEYNYLHKPLNLSNPNHLEYKMNIIIKFYDIIKYIK